MASWRLGGRIACLAMPSARAIRSYLRSLPLPAIPLLSLSPRMLRESERNQEVAVDKLDADSCGKTVPCLPSPSRFIPVTGPPPRPPGAHGAGRARRMRRHRLHGGNRAARRMTPGFAGRSCGAARFRHAPRHGSARLMVAPLPCRRRSPPSAATRPCGPRALRAPCFEALACPVGREPPDRSAGNRSRNLSRSR